MIDMTAQNSEGAATLNRVSVRADGAEDAYAYDTDLTFPVSNIEEARVLQKMVPGLVDVFVRSSTSENAGRLEKFQITHSPDIKMHATVAESQAGSDAGRVIVDGRADLRKIEVRGSKRGVMVTLKVRFGGRPASTGTDLIRGLRKTVTIAIELDQKVLPFVKPGEASSVVLPAIGAIVTARHKGDKITGRVTEIDRQPGAILVYVDDFGDVSAVDPSEIRSSIAVADPDDKQAAAFKSKARRRKHTPTWKALLVAIGEVGKYTDGEGGRVYGLTPEVVDAALEKLAAGIVDEDDDEDSDDEDVSELPDGDASTVANG